MPKIRISNTDTAIWCDEGANLLHVLLKEGIFVDSPCGGKGTCGKCKVRIVSGNGTALSHGEKKFLTEEERQKGIRLSCFVEVKEDMEVALLKQEKEGKVMTEGYLPEFEREYKEGYGIAVDIGTTTVVMELVDLSTGKICQHASRINGQKQYGLDVLTRISYEYEHPETGAEELQKAIVDCLNEMLEEVYKKAGIAPEDIKEIDVAANCTMLHMLLGADARPIGRSPYQPEFTNSKTLFASDIGLNTGEKTVLYCLPSVSAFIGADIVAGAYVCGLQKEKKNVLFIDIGTNGEIVLAAQGRLFSCSCAAGPALEGMNISCGMRAAEGAIEEVEMTPQGVKLTVIGGKEPEGFCGSGILAAVRELLKIGVIKKTGVFVKKESLEESDDRFSLIRLNGTKREAVFSEKPELFLTQGDIRQVQLAKGAVLSGFKTLLKQAKVKMEDLDQVLIAGQFGAYLPACSLTGVGILPDEVKERISYVGNTSKTGAYMALMSENAKKEMEELAEKIEYMELAETEGYERIFTESMIFPN